MTLPLLLFPRISQQWIHSIKCLLKPPNICYCQSSWKRFLNLLASITTSPWSPALAGSWTPRNYFFVCRLPCSSSSTFLKLSTHHSPFQLFGPQQTVSLLLSKWMKTTGRKHFLFLLKPTLQPSLSFWDKSHSLFPNFALQLSLTPQRLPHFPCIFNFSPSC